MVLTVTLKVAAVVALTLKVLVRLQLAPVGAPVQLSEAIPPTPPPPMESVYDAGLPALTTAVLEPPGGKPNPRLGLAAWPDRDTIWGEPAALSVMDSAPVRVPKADGEKITEIWHVFPAEPEPSPRPQLFVSEKSPLTPILEIVRLASPLFVNVTC